MFNRLLKKNLQDQDDELFHLRQLVAQFDRGRLSIALDAEYRITAVNDAFARVLGYPPEHLQGRLLGEVVPPYVKDLPLFLLISAELRQRKQG